MAMKSNNKNREGGRKNVSEEEAWAGDGLVFQQGEVERVMLVVGHSKVYQGVERTWPLGVQLAPKHTITAVSIVISRSLGDTT